MSRRAKKRTRIDADAGVRDCMELMAAKLWKPGGSHKAVAARHGVSPATVKDWATCASRLIRLYVDADRERWRAKLVATLEMVVSKGMRGDLRAVVSAVAEEGKLLGLVIQKHEVQMTEEQAREKYRQLTGHDWSPPPEDLPSCPPPEDLPS